LKNLLDDHTLPTPPGAALAEPRVRKGRIRWVAGARSLDHHRGATSIREA